MRKPRLTKKVLDGLNAILCHVEAGDAINGDLRDDRDAVRAASRWVTAMLAHRAEREAADA